ncbi:THO complex subunit 6 [Tribolium madens]|uniref:THO complex subunit 6 n=1 Tax=Tribolium madens TaxID=41895 RepID=UPI001CF7628C|nr:THO complex subunit 6 [Tribolium madens]
MVNKLNKSFYNTVLSQTFTPCGNYLVVGDIYGTISVFHLSKLTNQGSSITKEDQLPKNTFTIKEDVQINSLLTTKSFLVVGTVGEILGYAWKNVKTSKKPSCSWSIEIPNSKDSFDKPDVNCLVLENENNLLFAACGDNNVYIFNIETRKEVRSLRGHKNYIHCINFFNNKLVSGGEDGLVLLWDVRGGPPVSRIEPHTRDKVARGELGPWIGGVGINDDWLLCGGGPRLSLWHLRSLNVSTVFPIDDKGIHVAEIYQDRIFAGGRSSLFYQMSFNGDIITEIPTSPVTSYSAVHQEEPFQTLCIAGSSPKIDVCSNFIYKNLQLSLY